MKQKILNYLKAVKSFQEQKPILACISIALIINFFIEILSRHSLIKAVVHLCTSPLVFCYNTAIIFMTLSVAFLFKRRNFFITLLSMLWISLGAINCILLFFRTTPLSLIDFAIVKTATTMLPIYLSKFEFILIILWVVAIIAAAVLSWRKMQKNFVKLKKSAALVVSSVLVVVVSSIVSTSVAAKNGSFAILTKAYDTWGFVYCFSRSLIDSGIDKPGPYSEFSVDATLKVLEQPEKEEKILPNIVVLQLESFFDVSYLKNYTCSQNPIPNFTALRDTCPSGLLTMPSLGGGTANSEFEFLTGINLDFFGVGEYPYQTILKTQPCDSMARTLKDKGYVSTAIHNHTAAFYSRFKVYANLGFDKFVPIEYMDYPVKNELGWSKDDILFKEIEDAMTSTKERDFVFTVTVQGHGKYPEEEMEYSNKLLTVGGYDPLDEEQVAFKYGLEYYINQIYETDLLIGQLVEYFKNYPEPVALVLYGDHLPAMKISDESLNGINMYQTEYCIWTNYTDLENTTEDIPAYQLNALLFDKLDLNCGMFPRVTQKLKNDEYYLDTLSLLAYDILYGKNYSMGEKLVRSDMQFGIRPITVTGITINGDTALVSGGKFTPYTHVLVDGKKINTIFIDANTLEINVKDLNPEGCTIKTAQINKQLKHLSESNSIAVAPFENPSQN